MKLRMTALIVLPLALLSFGAARAQDAGSANTQTSNPDASGHYHVGNGVTAPKIVHSVDPTYTDLARRMNIKGVCFLSLTVDEAGMPQNISVTRSVAESQPAELRAAATGLDASAIRAVSKFRFRPGMFKGQPVPVDIHVEMNFQLY